jgi:hypothetical protein
VPLLRAEQVQHVRRAECLNEARAGMFPQLRRYLREPDTWLPSSGVSIHATSNLPSPVEWSMRKRPYLR